MSQRSDPNLLRRANLAVVFRCIVTGEAPSRARIADETGLNKSTVSSLVSELEDLGLVHDGVDEARRPTVGRPGTPVVPDARTAAIGVEIGADGISIVVETIVGEVQYACHRREDLRGTSAEVVLDRAAGLIGSVGEQAERDGLEVAGIGVAIAGLVSARDGAVVYAPNLGWRRVDARRYLASRIGLPAERMVVHNEANCAALAELWRGAARDVRSFVYVMGRVGVGAGIVIGGRLFGGEHGYAGEIGHVIVDANGLPCACGSRGCLETVAGIEAIRIRAGLSTDTARGEYEAAEDLARRARAGEPRVLDALGEAAGALGVSLSGTINLLDVQTVVLGGAFQPLAQWLVPRVKRMLALGVLGVDGVEVRESALGLDGPARGAAGAMLELVIAEPWRMGTSAPAAASRKQSVQI